MSQNENKGVYLVLTALVTLGLFVCFWVFVLSNEKEKDDVIAAKKENWLNDDAAMLVSHGQNALELNNIQEAIAAFERAQLFAPDDNLLKQELARAYAADCLANKENCEQAKWYYSYLIELFPDDEILLQERADLFYALGDTAAYGADVKRIQEIRLENELNSIR